MMEIGSGVFRKINSWTLQKKKKNLCEWNIKTEGKKCLGRLRISPHGMISSFEIARNSQFKSQTVIKSSASQLTQISILLP